MKDEISGENRKINKEFDELKKKFDDLEPISEYFDLELCKFVLDLNTWVEKYR